MKKVNQIFLTLFQIKPDSWATWYSSVLVSANFLIPISVVLYLTDIIIGVPYSAKICVGVIMAIAYTAIIFATKECITGKNKQRQTVMWVVAQQNSLIALSIFLFDTIHGQYVWFLALMNGVAIILFTVRQSVKHIIYQYDEEGNLVSKEKENVYEYTYRKDGTLLSYNDMKKNILYNFDENGVCIETCEGIRYYRINGERREQKLTRALTEN